MGSDRGAGIRCVFVCVCVGVGVCVCVCVCAALYRHHALPPTPHGSADGIGPNKDAWCHIKMQEHSVNGT